MRPTMMNRAQAIRPVSAAAMAMPKTAPPPRLVPALVFGTAGALVVYYVQSQLTRTSGDFDRAFAQYNSPESEASRARSFAGAVEDPRTSFFNALGWKRS